MGRPIQAATSRKFRVFWYETVQPQVFIGKKPLPEAPRGVPLPRKQKAKRIATFEVEARTLDRARVVAREYVRKRLEPTHQVLAVNFTQRPHELVVYSTERPHEQTRNLRR